MSESKFIEGNYNPVIVLYFGDPDLGKARREENNGETNEKE